MTPQYPDPPKTFKNHDLEQVLNSVEDAANVVEQYIIANRDKISDLTFFSLVSMLTDCRVALVQLSVEATKRHQDNLSWLNKAIDELAISRGLMRQATKPTP